MSIPFESPGDTLAQYFQALESEYPDLNVIAMLNAGLTLQETEIYADLSSTTTLGPPVSTEPARRNQHHIIDVDALKPGLKVQLRSVFEILTPIVTLASPPYQDEDGGWWVDTEEIFFLTEEEEKAHDLHHDDFFTHTRISLEDRGLIANQLGLFATQNWLEFPD